METSDQQIIADSLRDGDSPPEMIASDYVELVSLVLIFVVGAPLNLAAWTQIAERPVSSRLDILKKHLNYSDLLVLFVYVPSRACWLITYDWRGGDLLCRLVKFMHYFAFQISSNVIVCIALDRLLSVLSASHRNPEQAARRMRIMLLVAWVTALLVSTPQFAFWRSFAAFQNPPWNQCMQIWEIQRAVLRSDSANGSMAAEDRLTDQENIYLLVHMLLIFWVPALIIMLCYLLLSCWVYINSRPNLFDLAQSEKGGGDCAQQEQKQQLMALRPSKVSYHLTNTGPGTVDTMVTTVLNGPLNPTIVINDDMDRPVPLSTSPSPQQQQQNVPVDPRNSSSVSQHEAAMMLASNRQRQSSSYSAKSQRNRAIRVSFLLVVGYFACWLPYNCLSLIQFIDPQLYHRHASKVFFLHNIIVFNSVINPYLYGLCGGLCRQRRRDS